jgi:hypothetical protein
MIGYRDTLYIFGGEVGFSNGVETPLWTYNITVRRSIPYIFIQFTVKPICLMYFTVFITDLHITEILFKK